MLAIVAEDDPNRVSHFSPNEWSHETEMLPLRRSGLQSVECAVRVLSVQSLDIRRGNRLLDWLRVEHEIEKPSVKVQSPFELDSDAFVAEVKKLRGRRSPLSAAGLKNLRDELGVATPA